MTTIKAHLPSCELEARYKGAADPIAKSHFHALWLLSLGYEVDEIAELLSFSPRWVWSAGVMEGQPAPPAPRASLALPRTGRGTPSRQGENTSNFRVALRKSSPRCRVAPGCLSSRDQWLVGKRQFGQSEEGV
jgi:hypothetical protein